MKMVTLAELGLEFQLPLIGFFGSSWVSIWLKLFHLTLPVHVGLVSDDQHRELVAVLHPQHLLVELVHLLEGLPLREGEHQQEALPGPHVLLAHRAELLLPGRVEDVQPRHVIVDHALLGVGVLYRWVIVGDEIALKRDF